MNNFIKLTIDYSKSKINFLHTTVYIDINNTITTTVYRKPTDSYSYLHPKSSHPPHTFSSIPYSQTLRYRRICSKESDFKQQDNNLKETFLNLDIEKFPSRKPSKKHKIPHFLNSSTTNINLKKTEPHW